MKKIKIYIIFIIILFSLTGCGNESNNDIEKLETKNREELKYLNSVIIEIANNLNNITFENYEVVRSKTNQEATSSKGSSESNAKSNLEGSDGESDSDSGESSNNTVPSTEMVPINIITNSKKDIDWDKISYGVEKIYEAWSTTILDCYKLNAKNEDILDFSSKLDYLTLNVKAKDKTNTLISLTQIYSDIPKFIESYDEGSIISNILYTKSNILNAYSNVEQNKWDVTLQELNNAENYFKNVVNDAEYSNKHKINVDKTYILLKELQNSVKLKDKEVFLIKYKMLMIEIKILD